MKVRAIKLGYYNDKRQKPGAVFHLKNKDKDFSSKWMEEVKASAPVKKKASKKASKKDESKKEEVVSTETEVI